jgi:hypothetical protein
MIPGGWLGILAVGIILGAIGQGARTIVGFKKYNDDDDPAALFDGVRLLISFGIGGVAGALAAITLIPEGQASKEQLFGIAAAGYAGTDFIEGFITRLSGGTSSSSANSAPPAAAPPAGLSAAAGTSSDDAVG